MFHGKTFQRVVPAAFVLVFVLAGVACAHLPVFSPDRFSVSVGEKIRAITGLSEPLIAMAYSREQLLARGYAGRPGVADLSGAVFYKDGSKTILAPGDFVPFNTVDAANTDPASADADVVAFAVEKAGTAVATMRLDFNSGTRPTVAFGKTFLNRTTDGMTTRRFGGDDVLEIVTDGEASFVARGDAVKVRVFLRGKPLANAEVSATYDGAPRHTESDEPDNNEYLHADTDAEGRVSFVMDRAGTWVVGIEYVDETFDSKNPAYGPNAGVRYRATLLFPVSENRQGE